MLTSAQWRQQIEAKKAAIEQIEAKIKDLQKQARHAHYSQRAEIQAQVDHCNGQIGGLEKQINQITTFEIPRAEQAERVAASIQADEQRKQAEAEAATAEERERVTKQAAWEAFKASGGSYEQFSVQWPMIKQQIATQAATEAAAAALDAVLPGTPAQRAAHEALKSRYGGYKATITP